ncbi:MAG: aminoacyl-tRNA hydrolase [Candidatus Kerfeldbacteria bacterium]|nr:aminoacyl-tRNA hydrolase [Candidatus Kerfeldbacteria bacterium]
MKLIIGLGNPGSEYEKTRHNVGWRVLDFLQLDFAVEKKFNAELARRDNVLFCKPLTFMNNSGVAVRTIADYYKIAPADIVVIYDDKDLPFGTVRIRSTGSAGGHNGVASVIQHLGTMEFGRMRIGILSEEHRGDTSNFVLARFSKDEETLVPKMLAAATKELDLLMRGTAPADAHRDIHVFEDQ